MGAYGLLRMAPGVFGVKRDKRFLIVNADDFGHSSNVNQGVEKCHREGILTSATLMANMPGFSEAVIIAKRNPKLGVGVHLNILRGTPLSKKEEVPELIDEKGNFTPSFLSKIIQGFTQKAFLQQLEKELRAQIEKVSGAGIQITHFDSEMHSHLVIPHYFQLVCRLAEEYKVPSLRLVKEKLSSAPLFSPQFPKLLLLLATSRYYRFRYPEVNSCDTFIGVGMTGSVSEGNIVKELSSLPSGVTELMVHPGIVGDANTSSFPPDFFIYKTWEEEVKALTSPLVKACVEREKIRLCHYGEITS